MGIINFLNDVACVNISLVDDKAKASIALFDDNSFCPTPTPTLTATRTLTPTPTPTAGSTATPTPTRTLTPTPSATRTLTPTQTPTLTATRTLTPTQTPTLTATRTLTPTQTPTLTATRTLTPTQTPTLTATRTLTPTQTPTLTATRTLTPTQTPTLTATQTLTPTQTPTLTATNTPTASSSALNLYSIKLCCNPAIERILETSATFGSGESVMINGFCYEIGDITTGSPDFTAYDTNYANCGECQAYQPYEVWLALCCNNPAITQYFRGAPGALSPGIVVQDQATDICYIVDTCVDEAYTADYSATHGTCTDCTRSGGQNC